MKNNLLLTILLSSQIYAQEPPKEFSVEVPQNQSTAPSSSRVYIHIDSPNFKKALIAIDITEGDVAAKEFHETLTSNLDYTNSVGNIQGIIILAQSDVALLQSSGSDQSIDLFTFNVIQIPNGGLDLTLIGLNIHNKYQSVGVFNEFH